jgi:hypothetical protein
MSSILHAPGEARGTEALAPTSPHARSRGSCGPRSGSRALGVCSGRQEKPAGIRRRVLLSRACGTLNDAQFAPQGRRTESPLRPRRRLPHRRGTSGSLHAYAAGRDGSRASSWTSSGRRHCRCGVAQVAAEIHSPLYSPGTQAPVVMRHCGRFGAVSKTVVGLTVHRGFESLPLRYKRQRFESSRAHSSSVQTTTKAPADGIRQATRRCALNGSRCRSSSKAIVRVAWLGASACASRRQRWCSTSIRSAAHARALIVPMHGTQRVRPSGASGGRRQASTSSAPP